MSSFDQGAVSNRTDGKISSAQDEARAAVSGQGAAADHHIRRIACRKTREIKPDFEENSRRGTCAGDRSANSFA
jgi:hypothetical protein